MTMRYGFGPGLHAGAGLGLAGIRFRTSDSFVITRKPGLGISAELGRRGFAPAYGTHLRIRGPVVNSFDVQMWVLSPGQVEFLD